MGIGPSHIPACHVPTWVAAITPVSGIKAKAVFEPDDLVKFLKWQAIMKHNEKRLGYIFNGFEYYAFLDWRDGTKLGPPEGPKDL